MFLMRFVFRSLFHDSWFVSHSTDILLHFLPTRRLSLLWSHRSSKTKESVSLFNGVMERFLRSHPSRHVALRPQFTLQPLPSVALTSLSLFMTMTCQMHRLAIRFFRYIPFFLPSLSPLVSPPASCFSPTHLRLTTNS